MMFSDGRPTQDTDNVPDMRVIRVHINDWVASTRGMSLDEEGFFWRFTCLFYDRMGDLPDDDQIIARALNLDIRRYRNMKKIMVGLGKISLEEGRLTNARAVREINIYLEQSKRRSDAAREREQFKRSASIGDEICPTSAPMSPRHRRDFETEVAPMSNRLSSQLSRDISKNSSENNMCKATTVPGGDASPHARARPKPKPKPLSEVIPPTPLGGKGEGQSPPSSDPTKSRMPQATDDVELALAAYNEAAEQLGFSRCESFTKARRTRLTARLADIGGVKRFRDALRALDMDDALPRLLLGKAKPKEGNPLFRLDIDRLLRSDGSLGDVLARLLDISAAPGAPNRARPWECWSDDEWKHQIVLHANGRWPPDKLGPYPCTKKTAVPPSIIKSERLIERYDEDGFSREKH